MNKLQQSSGILQVLFWGSFVFFILLGIWGFCENNMPVVGIFWAGFVTVVYWLIKIGKIKTGIARGFVFGVLIDFVLLFILHKLQPEEDVAGIVIISLVLSGLLFGLVGFLIQKYFVKS